MSAYQIKLRSSELYVLAGFLGYKSIIGIEDDTLIKWHSELNSKINRTIRSLEKKKIIQTTLNGVLFIDENLKKAIELLCGAEKIGVISSNIDKNRTETTYITSVDSNFLVLKKYKDNKYLLSLYDDMSFLDLTFASFHMTDKKINEIWLYEDAQYIKELLFSFDEDGALDRARKCVKDYQAAEDVLTIVSGKNKFLNIQMYKKQGDLYINSFNTFLVLAGKTPVELKLDDNKVLFIDSVNVELIKNKVKNVLSSGQEVL